MAPDDDDRKVKQLLDEASAVTEDDLARWFTLPSFQQLAEQPPPQPQQQLDAAIQEVRERRERALEAVDLALVARIEQRVEQRPERLIQFKPAIDLHVDEQFGTLDASMIDRGFTIAEPREVEIPEPLRDDLRDCTPQALLRDLHRAVFDFDKTFEIVDFAAEQRVDAAQEIKAAMSAMRASAELGASAFAESRSLVEDLRAQRRRPWVTDVLPTLRNRRVTE